jgi:hypothetical protein
MVKHFAEIFCSIMFSYVTIIEVYKSFSIVCPNLLNKKRKFSQSLLLFQQLLEYEKNDMRLFLSLPLISQNYKPLLTIVVVTVLPLVSKSSIWTFGRLSSVVVVTVVVVVVFVVVVGVVLGVVVVFSVVVVGPVCSNLNDKSVFCRETMKSWFTLVAAVSLLSTFSKLFILGRRVGPKGKVFRGERGQILLTISFQISKILC